MDRGRLNILVEKLHLAQENGDEDNELDCMLKLAEYHYNNSDFDKARLSLKQIIKKRPEFPNINYYLSLISVNEGRFEECIRFIDEELKINPKNGYARELREKVTIHTNIPVITIAVFILNFLLMIFSYPEVTFVNSIKYGLSDVNFTIFNAFTSLFLHINLYHFLVNMAILLMFGLILEKNIGSMKFLLIYCLSGLFGNLLEIYLASDGIVMGASASLFGVLGAIMMREPLMKVKYLGIFNVPIIIVLGGFFLLGFIVNSVFNISFITGDIAHFSGLLLGIFVIGLIYQETIDIFYNWVFIALGFWMLQYSLNNFVVYGLENLNLDIVNLFIILIGLYLIAYSYVKLERLCGIGGIENEYDK